MIGLAWTILVLPRDFSDEEAERICIRITNNTCSRMDEQFPRFTYHQAERGRLGSVVMYASNLGDGKLL